MDDSSLALLLLVVGLALAVPVACWFGIAIGEERALQRVRQAQQRYVDSLRDQLL